MLTYDDRELFDVDIFGISRSILNDGSDGIATRVAITLTSRDDPELPGPVVSVELNIPVPGSASLEEAETLSLDAARAVIARVASETLESFVKAIQSQRTQRAAMVQQNFLPIKS